MRTAVNVAIVLLAAAALAFLPSGSEFAAVAGRSLSLGFLLVAALGFAYAYRRFGSDFERLPAGFRALGLGAVGVLVLTFAGWSRLLAGQGGIVAALLLLGACAAAIFVVWQRYRAIT
ncbi:MAG: hypothetical protein WCK97_02470 [Actinomycetes bacterium]